MTKRILAVFIMLLAARIGWWLHVPRGCAQSISCGTVSTLTVALTSSGSGVTPRQGIVYDGRIKATGGTPCAGGTYTYAFVSGTLPPGLGPLNTATGSIPGTPTAPTNPYAFTVKASDCGVGTQQQTVSLPINMIVATVSSIAVTPASPSITQQSTLQMTAKATWTDNAVTTITSVAAWASSAPSIATVSSGGSGGLGSAGLVTALTTNGTTNITAALNGVTSPTDTVTVTGGTPPTLVIQQTTVPNGQHGILYAPFTFTAICSGVACTATPYTWSVSVGAPPTGMTLNPSSTLSTTYTGTPTGTTATFTARVVDSGGRSATQSITHTIATETGPVTVTCTGTGCATINQGGQVQLTAKQTYSDGSTADVSTGSSTLALRTNGVWNTRTGSTAVTSLSQTVSVTAGDDVIACGDQGTNNTDNFTIASTPAATWTQFAAGYYTAGGARQLSCWFTKNAPAITNVTLTFNTGGGVTFAGLIVADIINGSSSDAEDGTSLGSQCGGCTSNTSGNLTTTGTNDFFFFFVRNNSDQTSWTAGSPYTIPNNGVATGNNGSNIRDAIEYQTVSSAQTAVNTTMSFSASAPTSAGIFGALKGTAGGTQWSQTSGTGTCTVSSRGLVIGTQPGTCVIQASNTGFSGTITITVNAPTFTSITVAPSNPSISVGSIQTFTATGNPGAVNVTTNSAWSSSAVSVATMNGNVATCLAGGTTTITAQFNQSGGPISGNTALTCNVVSGTSLLQGCTVNASNQPQGGVSNQCAGGAVPAGWTLVQAQGFESGAIRPNEYLLGSSGGSTHLVQDATHAHTGSWSVVGSYTADGTIVAWGISPGNVGSFSTIYISYWDFVDPQALFPNSDYAMQTVYNYNCQPNNQQQSFGMDGQYPPPNVAQAAFTGMTPVSQGDGPTCQGTYQNDKTYFSQQINAGRWMQVELYYHPSTTFSGGADCTDANGGIGKCHGDGEFHYYLDGQEKTGAAGRNLNGSVNMANSNVEIGGVFTSFWYANPNGCRCNPSAGIECSAALQSGTCVGPNPPSTSAPPPFNRYMDDVIIMKQ